MVPVLHLLLVGGIVGADGGGRGEPVINLSGLLTESADAAAPGGQAVVAGRLLELVLASQTLASGGLYTALASQGGQQQKDAAREEAPLIPSDLLSVLPIQDAGAPEAKAAASALVETPTESMLPCVRHQKRCRTRTKRRREFRKPRQPEVCCARVLHHASWRGTSPLVL